MYTYWFFCLYLVAERYSRSKDTVGIDQWLQMFFFFSSSSLSLHAANKCVYIKFYCLPFGIIDHVLSNQYIQPPQRILLCFFFKKLLKRWRWMLRKKKKMPNFICVFSLMLWNGAIFCLPCYPWMILCIRYTCLTCLSF